MNYRVVVNPRDNGLHVSGTSRVINLKRALDKGPGPLGNARVLDVVQAAVERAQERGRSSPSVGIDGGGDGQ